MASSVQVDISRMTEEYAKKLLKEYSDLGWEIVGTSDFPPPHQWIILAWHGDGEGPYPNRPKG